MVCDVAPPVAPKPNCKQGWDLVDDLLRLPSDFRLRKVGGVDWADLDLGCDLERGDTSASPSFGHTQRNFRNPIRFLGWTQEAGDTTIWMAAFVGSVRLRR